MKALKHVSRLTLDIPENLHKKLKMRAASRGISMKELVLDAIEESTSGLCEYGYSHQKLNAETEKSIKEVESGKAELHKFDSTEEAFKFLDALSSKEVE